MAKWKPETLDQYRDIWSALLLQAPDNFTDTIGNLLPDQRAALIEDFARLKDGFHFARKNIKDERLLRIAEELIEMSLESYVKGNKTSGAHMLQECQGLIWPGRKLRVKYGVEAERRAFGDNILHANVVVSPYDYEGTTADLGEHQRRLLSLAKMWCRRYQADGKDFKYFSWVVDIGGAVRRLSAQPCEDHHATFPPVQKSRGYKRLKELGDSKSITACVLMEVISPLGDGIVVFDLEEKGRPKVSARQLFKRPERDTIYDRVRYYIEDPDIIH